MPLILEYSLSILGEHTEVNMEGGTGNYTRLGNRMENYNESDINRGVDNRLDKM